MPYRRSISHYACPRTTSFIEFLDAVEGAGFDGIAITLPSIEEMQPVDMRPELRRRGLSVTSVNSAGYFLYSEPDRAAEQELRNSSLLETTADIEAEALNVIVGGPGRHAWPLSSARARALEALANLDERAAALGVGLIVEPVHPLAISEKGCLNTIAQVEASISGLRASALNIDLFHSWWDPDLDRALCDPKVAAGLLQICGVEVSPSPPFATRTFPEKGSVDPLPVMRQFHATFPDAPIELELFADQLAGVPLSTVLRSAQTAFEGARI